MGKSERALVISPQVTVKWREGALRVEPQSGRGIESRDPTMLWLLHEFASPRLPKEVASSLPGTPAATLETAIADLQATGILVPAPPGSTGGRGKSAKVEARGDKVRRKSIPGTEQAELTASVIICTRNRAKHLDYTLASYLLQTDERFELVIVDDGSTDDTARIVEHYDGRLFIRHLRQSKVGRSAARNVALHEAEGDIAIFTDDDRIVCPGFVAQHLAAHDDADAESFVLGGQRNITTIIDRGLLGQSYPVLARQLEGDEARKADSLALFEPADIAERFDEVVREFSTEDAPWQERLQPAVDHAGDDLDELDVAWYLVSLSNLSVPRQAAIDVGAFDEGYHGFGIDGVDLCYALARQGAGARLNRNALSYHQLHARRDVSEPRRRSLRYFRRKHDRLEARLFLWWMVGGIGIVEADRIAGAAHSGRAATDPVLRALDDALVELIEAKLQA